MLHEMHVQPLMQIKETGANGNSRKCVVALRRIPDIDALFYRLDASPTIDERPAAHLIQAFSSTGRAAKSQPA